MGEQKRESIGSIWENKSKAGNTYLSIVIGNKTYLAFKNSYKKEDSQPLYKIFEKEERSNVVTGDKAIEELNQMQPEESDNLPF